MAMAALAWGCASRAGNVFPNESPSEDAALDPDLSEGAPPRGPCKGLQCQQVTCSSGKTTSLSGTVYMPNGTLPVYGAVVYVPNAPLDPIHEGVSCDRCGTSVSGSPIVTTLSGATGRFRLDDVPAGNDIPVVVQLGKWRKKLLVPLVAPCEENPIGGSTLRLPGKAGEGSMPRIAVVTGGCDPLACILPKIGIHASEFGVSPNAPGKVVLYAGEGGMGPAGIQPAQSLWSSAAELSRYDMVILSCECSEYDADKGPPAPSALQQFADTGGRVFASHYHYTWFKDLVPAWAQTASWGDAPSSPPNTIDRTFPKGKALADWLQLVAPTTKYGELPLAQPTYDVGAVGAPTTRWVYSALGGTTTHFLSFNTPVASPPAEQCGKAVFGGMHISAQGGSVDPHFPNNCGATMTPQEDVLAFLLFDLASCIQKDTDAPMPPQPQ